MILVLSHVPHDEVHPQHDMVYRSCDKDVMDQHKHWTMGEGMMAHMRFKPHINLQLCSRQYRHCLHDEGSAQQLIDPVVKKASCFMIWSHAKIPVVPSFSR